MFAVGTLVVAGVLGGPFAARGGASASADASEAFLVKPPAPTAQADDAQDAAFVAPTAIAAPSVAVATPGTPAVTTAPAPPAPAPDPTAPALAREAMPSPPVRGSVASATLPAGDPSPTAALGTCPQDWICYPRLGVAGPIVPYSDCTGATDIRRAIVSFTCLSSPASTYLIGHAYTQFGNITGWAAGDVVQANGVTYAVTGAIVDRSCAAPSLPLARLSMQTSLGPSACGPVLVVQAR